MFNLFEKNIYMTLETVFLALGEFGNESVRACSCVRARACTCVSEKGTFIWKGFAICTKLGQSVTHFL